MKTSKGEGVVLGYSDLGDGWVGVRIPGFDGHDCHAQFGKIGGEGYWFQPCDLELINDYLEPIEEDRIESFKSAFDDVHDIPDEYKAFSQIVPRLLHITNQDSQKLINNVYMAMLAHSARSHKSMFITDEIKEYNYKPTLKQKVMNIYKKARMSKDEKVLHKGGFMNDDGTPTSAGQDALMFTLWEANKAALVDMAQEAIDEAEKD